MILHPQHIGHTTTNRHCRGTMDQTPISAEVWKPGIRHELLDFGDSIGIWKNLDPILTWKSRSKKSCRVSILSQHICPLIHISFCVSQNPPKKAANPTNQHVFCLVLLDFRIDLLTSSIFGGPVQWYFHHAINHQF